MRVPGKGDSTPASAELVKGCKKAGVGEQRAKGSLMPDETGGGPCGPCNAPATQAVESH